MLNTARTEAKRIAGTQKQVKMQTGNTEVLNRESTMVFETRRQGAEYYSP